MREIARGARVMAMATKREISTRKREMASNDDIKTKATETRTMTTTTTATNSTMLTRTLTMKTTTMTKTTTTTVRWWQLVVAGSGGGGQRRQRRRGLSVHTFIETEFWVVLVVGKGQVSQAGGKPKVSTQKSPRT
jgi:hypothetical protein